MGESVASIDAFFESVIGDGKYAGQGEATFRRLVETAKDAVDVASSAQATKRAIASGLFSSDVSSLVPLPRTCSLLQNQKNKNTHTGCCSHFYDCRLSLLS